MKINKEKNLDNQMLRWSKYSVEERLNWLGSAWEFVQALKSGKKSKPPTYVKN